MDKVNINEATCDSCARVFWAASKRHYCSHCNKYYYVCNTCVDTVAKCRYCGISLKRKSEPQLNKITQKRSLQRV